MKVTFWGTRGSIPAPGKETILYGGNTTCLELMLQQGSRVVIDAGSGIRVLGEKLKAEQEEVDLYLLITHIHWDHVMGFPFFAPIYKPSTRIRVDGYPTCMKGISHAFDTKMGDGFFPVKFNDLKADIQYLDRIGNGFLEIDGTIIDTIPLHHPQGGFGYRFREGEKTLVFITDNELTDEAWSGRTPEDYTAFCRDADILIHDAQYTPEEIDERRGWGHSNYEATLELARRAGVKKLLLFHHDPARTDAEVTAIRMQCIELVAARNSPLVVEAAKEGDELLL
jgi:phosphoribosyl 1,2-cyclic phosphodiesterase